jgi:hypothetical protein
MAKRGTVTIGFHPGRRSWLTLASDDSVRPGDWKNESEALRFACRLQRNGPEYGIEYSVYKGSVERVNGKWKAKPSKTGRVNCATVLTPGYDRYRKSKRSFGDPPGIHHNRRIDAERESDRYLDLAEEALEDRGDCGKALNRLKASSLFLGQAGCHSNSGGGNIPQALYNHGAKVWGKFNKVCIKKAR